MGLGYMKTMAKYSKLAGLSRINTLTSLLYVNMEEIITQAVKYLKNSGVISLPTETVYSLSANACDDKAVERVYQLKGRNKENPLALLVGSIASALEMVEFSPEAKILAEKFFPGPLTLVLPKKNNIRLSHIVNEGMESLAVRMPNHKTTLEILNALDFPVVGTSANPSGLPPAACAHEVAGYFNGKLDLIVDGGNCDIGIASTILDLTKPGYLILRQGSISEKQIRDVLK